MRTATKKSLEHPAVRLRLLQTTDLHMQLIPYDYSAMAPAVDCSLVHLRTSIAALRDEGIPSLLCDTGDFIQGSAAADIAIEVPRPHPMIATFNDMGYDAIVLGNHDFDYGIDNLRRALTDIACPVLAANLTDTAQPQTAQAYVIVPVVVDTGDDARVVNVGLLGLTIPGITVVTAPERTTQEISIDPFEVAQDMLPRMRDDGADVIVALCHFGIHADDQTENIAARIAALPDVDAVLAGHTHDVFPGPDIDAAQGIDPHTGIVHGTPCVMAGAYGRHIGLIDLTLEPVGESWRVQAAQSRIVTPAPNKVPPPLSAPGLLALHDATLARLNTTIARTDVFLSTAFSYVQPDMAQQLLADSRIARIKTALAGTQFADRPVLGSAAPYRIGGKKVPHSFLNIQPGPITLRDVIGIYPYQDPVVGLAQTGAQIKAWLEQAAGFFNTITAGVTDQPLINTAFPSYYFKTLFGLTYVIDPSQPIGQRIQTLRHANTPVRDDDAFVVATTPHLKRVNPTAFLANTLCITPETSQDILTAHLQALGTVRDARRNVWDFAILPGTAAQFTTDATARPQDTGREVNASNTDTPDLKRFTLSFAAR